MEKFNSENNSMSKSQISKSTLLFLKDLSENNKREWFTEQKSRYIAAHQNMCDFVDALILEMNKHDQIENTSGKKSLFRIYRDVRFSKEKTPYNPRFAFSLRRATKLRRGGYYMNLSPGNTYLACGFFGPDPDDLKRIRLDIQGNYKEWKKMLNNKTLKDNFGNMRGEKVLTSPKGFSKDHPAIALLRHKQFIFRHDFKDKEIISENFLHIANDLFKSIRPFFNYMSAVLTTDANGEPLF